MEIKELKVTIGEVYEGYFNDAEEGVVGYNELLDMICADKTFHKEYETQWECKKCGYITISKSAPSICPLCGHPQGYFELFCEKF